MSKKLVENVSVVGTAGRITIKEGLRKKYNIKRGDLVTIFLEVEENQQNFLAKEQQAETIQT